LPDKDQKKKKNEGEGKKANKRSKSRQQLKGVWAYSGSVVDALGEEAEAAFLDPLEPFLEVRSCFEVKTALLTSSPLHSPLLTFHSL
jgi:hypothetical protein